MFIKRSLIHFRTTYLFKFSVHTIAIVFIPIYLFFTCFYIYFKQSSVEQLLTDYQTVLHTKTASIDSTFLSVAQLPTLFSADQRLLNYRHTDFTPQTAYELERLLKKYIPLNESISDIILYVAGHPYVYSTQGVYPLNDSLLSPVLDTGELIGNYVQNTAHYNQFIYHTYYSILNYPQPMICYASPLLLDQTSPIVSTCILLDFNRLMRIFNPSDLIKDSGLFVVTTHDEQIIYSNFDSSLLSTSSLFNSSGILDFDGKTYFTITSTSQYAPLNYILLLPKKMVLSTLPYLLPVLLGGFLLFTFLGSVCIYSFIKLHYQPIKALEDTSNTLIQQLDAPSCTPHNEIETVLNTLYRLNHHIQSQNLSIESSKPALKHALLLRMLEPYYMPPHEEASYQDLVTLDFSKPYFFTFIASSHHPTYGDMIDLVENFYYLEINTYGFIELNQHCIFIANASTCEPTSIHAYIDSLYACLKLAYPDLILGVSTIVASQEKTKLLYYQAKTCLEYQFIFTNSPIYFDIVNMKLFDQSVIHWRNIWSKKLIQCLKTHNDTDLVPTLNTFTTELKQHVLPYHCIEYICYELYYACQKFAISQSPHSKSLRESSYVFSSLEHFKDSVLDIHKIICTHCEFTHLPALQLSLENIKTYIDLHYCEADFSLQSLADHLQVTLSKLSRFFKTHTGTTLMDYLTQKRLSTAKKLLLETDLSLSDIISQVGYYSSSTFIQKFKSIEGMTPGEFRTQFKVLSQKEEVNIS